jgi:hypothetical protein
MPINRSNFVLTLTPAECQSRAPQNKLPAGVGFEPTRPLTRSGGLRGRSNKPCSGTRPINLFLRIRKSRLMLQHRRLFVFRAQLYQEPRICDKLLFSEFFASAPPTVVSCSKPRSHWQPSTYDRHPKMWHFLPCGKSRGVDSPHPLSLWGNKGYGQQGARGMGNKGWATRGVGNKGGGQQGVSNKGSNKGATRGQQGVKSKHLTLAIGSGMRKQWRGLCA